MPDGAHAVVLSPVHAPTTFEETVDRLGTAIRLGVLEPGHQLPPERELAEQLRISRSTLRQALTALVQSGHLVSLRGRGGGTFVVEKPPLASDSRAPLPSDWRDIIAARRAFEIGVICVAAERAIKAPDEVLGVLESMHEQVETMHRVAEDFAEYRRADIAVHIAFAEATGVDRLVLKATEIQSRASELIAHIAHPVEVLAHANGEHHRMIEAIERGDAISAMQLMRHHLSGTEHILAGLSPCQSNPS